MIKEIQYTSINRVLDDLHDDALMDDLTLEQAVRHTLRFIGKNGMPTLYQDKEIDVEIKDFRGALPCDLVSINQVKDCKNGLCMRSMTDTFNPEDESFRHNLWAEHTWKAQGRVLYTSFPEGVVKIAYRAVPVDEDGFPLLIDNEVFLSALESYISVQVLRNKFRSGKISAQVYQDAKQEYAWDAAKLNSEFTIPSPSEMESLMRMWSTMLPSQRQFDEGFHRLGQREYLRKW